MKALHGPFVLAQSLISQSEILEGVGLIGRDVYRLFKDGDGLVKTAELV